MNVSNQVGMAGIVSLTGAMPTGQDTARIHQSAEQFEALLIGQILQSVHDSDSGWLGGDDSSSSCATGFAEEQLANTIAQQGGFGLGKMIEQSLRSRSR